VAHIDYIWIPFYCSTNSVRALKVTKSIDYNQEKIAHWAYDFSTYFRPAQARRTDQNLLYPVIVVNTIPLWPVYPPCCEWVSWLWFVVLTCSWQWVSSTPSSLWGCPLEIQERARHTRGNAVQENCRHITGVHTECRDEAAWLLWVLLKSVSYQHWCMSVSAALILLFMQRQVFGSCCCCCYFKFFWQQPHGVDAPGRRCAPANFSSCKIYLQYL